ncbi:MAG: hypothetical protein ABSG46_13370 [Candidatus Binataceae bacterium]|jgi:hypothetical protein
MTELNLTVKLTGVRFFNSSSTWSAAEAQPLLICDRCHDAEEIVVATMQILPLEKTWSLCGLCAQELPAGFTLA